MPKILSLKKPSQTVNSKTQKPITQFFRSDQSKLKGSQVENGTEGSQEIDSKSCKRKAGSPAKLEASCEVVEIKSCSSIDNIKKLGNISKKLKSESAGTTFKYSNGEENLSFMQSPIKNNDCNNIQVPGDKKEERIPLSPLSTESINNSDNCSPHSKCESESILKENECINNQNTTPKKCLPAHEIMESPSSKQICTPNRPNRSPKGIKSINNSQSPRNISFNTPQKVENLHAECSPSKFGSTVKMLAFSQNEVEDMFGDDWDINHEDDLLEDLDLTMMQRCEVLSVKRYTNKLELRLKNDNGNRGTCFIEGFWMNTPIQDGEIVSLMATRNASGQFAVTNTSGLLSLRPDHLISSTSVVGGVFCKRKAVLQERFRGIDSANSAMTIGILIHELVQKALSRRIINVAVLRSEADNILKQSTQMLYDAGLTAEEAHTNIQMYIGPLADFMQRYVKENPGSIQPQKDQWNGHIDDVLDIEENVCCPKLGLKGKIDATLQVTIHNQSGAGGQRAAVPLELKSGRASGSAEHRGQLVLYGMMLGLQRGLLLYLRERVELREVKCGYPEQRDLLLLRNELAEHLAAGPAAVATEDIVDIEEAASLLQQTLPEPVHHENACTKCPYLTICSLHLWHTNGPVVSDNHPLAKLRSNALGHLTPEHIKYFLHWCSLLKLEEKEQLATSPLHALWTESIDKRVKRGACTANLKLKTVVPSGDRYEHVFEKGHINDDERKGRSNHTQGSQEGDYSIVSIENRPWLAAGVVTLVNDQEIRIMLERDLSRRQSKDTSYQIDAYESFTGTMHNLTNLGVLMEDSERALRLRRLIIERRAPQFAAKLAARVGRLGVRLMRALNVQQQRAVLRAVAAEDFALLRGLPGTGKTQTISVLIQMLVGLKQRVLVTAHTHSAVDTVLKRLPDTVRTMRLGAGGRAAPQLQARCEARLARGCRTPEQLAHLYNSMEVVGVTCLGAAHAILTKTTFDVCIVDEATQVLQCTVLRPLFAAKRFVLVGDPDQLPPVVRSRTARRIGMEESLFHRLMSEEATSTLRLQYRMNQPLADIANRVAYSGRLQCANQDVADAKLRIDIEKLSPMVEEEWLLSACSPAASRAAVFLSMPSPVADSVTSKNLANPDEACVVLAVVEALKLGGVPTCDIGVIAPYRDQVALLRRALAHFMVEASTVDQFQGRDKSVIIYSCAKRDDGQDDRKVKEGEVLNDQRRLAVSVTRAKHKLIVVGNERALLRYEPLHPLIQACETVPIQEAAVRQLLDKYKSFLT